MQFSPAVSTIAEAIQRLLGDTVQVRTATFDQPEHGLSEEILAATDVLTWWGHVAHARVADAVVDRVHERVLQGMGLVVLHSGHHSKIFTKLMGTTCALRWREAAERELVWNVAPGHPITRGLPEVFAIQLVILIVGLFQDYLIGAARRLACPYADLALERR